MFNIRISTVHSNQRLCENDISNTTIDLLYISNLGLLVLVWLKPDTPSVVDVVAKTFVMLFVLD